MNDPPTNMHRIDDRGNADNPNDIQDICSDDITSSDFALPLSRRRNTSTNLGKGGSDGDDGQSDNDLGYFEILSNVKRGPYNESTGADNTRQSEYEV